MGCGSADSTARSTIAGHPTALDGKEQRPIVAGRQRQRQNASGLIVDGRTVRL